MFKRIRNNLIIIPIIILIGFVALQRLTFDGDASPNYLLLVDGVMYRRVVPHPHRLEGDGIIDSRDMPSWFGEIFRLPLSFEQANSVPVGEVQSRVSSRRVPTENFQANHDIVGAQVRRTQSGITLVVVFDEYRYSYYREYFPLSQRTEPIYALGLFETPSAEKLPRWRGIVIGDAVFLQEQPMVGWNINRILTDETMDDTYVYVGEVLGVSDIWANPARNINFHANHEIVGARLYQSGNNLVAVFSTEWGVFYVRYTH